MIDDISSCQLGGHHAIHFAKIETTQSGTGILNDDPMDVGILLNQLIP
ncbi:Uncharacterised protein [Klebsiella pneumoniae]|uniref:Uncharacterized protein n=1 Tax=Klebsiella pneumoniae TaxID=573 RepID=A0A377TZD0_KLEPN|nr:Uncharacterised protein [Klebsiella pneumoniae]